MKILRNYGITGNCFKWLESFLTDRRFNVKIGQIISEERAINVGVPQGSVLGPFLFNVYVSGLISSFTDPLIVNKSFADDLKAYTIYSPSHSSNHHNT